MARTALTPSDAVEHTIASLTTTATLAPQSIEKTAAFMWQLAGYLERGRGIRSIAAVDHAVVAAFCVAPTRQGAPPSVAVMHLRRSSARLLYRTTRRLGHDVGDPTIDVRLPPRCSAPFRPLEDDEVELARAMALWSHDDVRLTTAWALCEATARTSELPWIRASDVDRAAGTVRLQGSSKAEPRTARLTSWGLVQLERRLERVGCSEEYLLGAGPSRDGRSQSSCVMTVSATLKRAGLHREPDLRPSSVAAWAGRRAFDEAGRIEDAARALGMASLDRTARFIGWSWTEQE